MFTKTVLFTLEAAQVLRTLHAYRLQVLQGLFKQQQFLLTDGLFSCPDCGPVFTGP